MLWGGWGEGGYNDPCNYLVPLFMVISEAYNGKKKNYLCYVLNDLHY